MKFLRLVGGGALVAGALALAAGTAGAQQIPGGTLGGQLYKNTGDVYVMFLGSDAQFNDDLRIFLSVGGSSQFIFDNHSATAGNEVQVTPTLITLNPGDETIFGICAAQSSTSGSTCTSGTSNPNQQVYYMGPASRNPDNIFHADVWDRATFIANATGQPGYAGILAALATDPDLQFVVGFEDLPASSSDRDYNDIYFAMKGVSTTVPEPVSMALLATGLVGMGGTGLVRRRRKQS